MDICPNIRSGRHIYWTQDALKFEIEEQELLDGLVDAIGGSPEGRAWTWLRGGQIDEVARAAEGAFDRT